MAGYYVSASLAAGYMSAVPSDSCPLHARPVLLTQVPGKSELQQLLAGRCRSHTDPPTAAAVFRSLGLRDPQQYTAGTNTSTTAVSEADVWDSVRQLLLAGEQVAAAQRVVACVRRLIDSGCRVTLTAPEWEAAWTALNRCAGLHCTFAKSVDRYLGGLRTAQSLGWAPKRGSIQPGPFSIWDVGLGL